MSKLEITEIHSKQYEIVIAPNTGGCFYIRRIVDGFETMLFQGDDATRDFAELKMAWRKKYRLFDTLCAEYSFNAPEEK